MQKLSPVDAANTIVAQTSGPAATLVGAIATALGNGGELTGSMRRTLEREAAKLDIEIDFDAASGPAQPAPVASIVMRNDRVAAFTPYGMKEAMKAIGGGRWNQPVKGAWNFPGDRADLAQAVIWVVESNLAGKPIHVDESVRKLAEQVAIFEDMLDSAASVLTMSDEEIDAIKIDGLTVDPWRHQKAMITFANALPGCMFHAGMGTGKSLASVAVAQNLGAEMPRVLIVCPSSVQRVWPREFRKWSSAPWEVAGLTPPGRRTPLSVARRTADMKRAYESNVANVACVINYEASIGKAFIDWASTQDWDLVIFDESQRLKGRGAWWKAAKRVARKADKILELSGTPMPHIPLDLWAQYYLLDPSLFGDSYYAFSQKFGVWGGFEGRQFLRMNPGHLDEFTKKRRSLAIEVSSDVLDLPPSRESVRYCRLRDDQLKAYRQMEANALAEIEGDDDKTATADIVLTQMLRLAQITGGALKDDDGVTHVVGEAKAKLLHEVLDEAGDRDGKPAVVFCRFHHDLDVVAQVAAERTADDKVADEDFAELSGRRNDLDEDAHIPDGFTGLFAVQIQAGGVGIDLTAAALGIYYSSDWGYGNDEQSQARLVRPGQESSVEFVRLVAEDTVDEAIIETLSGRGKLIDLVTNWKVGK